MDPESRVQSLFEQSIEVKQRAAAGLAGGVAHAARMLAEALRGGRKILACGNGGSAADAQHFAAELVNRFEAERPGLAALALTTDTSALTAIANDYGYDGVFSRQLHALGAPGDVLLAISTSGNSPSIVAAVEAAHAADVAVVALTGGSGGKVAGTLGGADLELRVPSDSTARIQEVHLLIIHCVCHLLDVDFGDES